FAASLNACLSSASVLAFTMKIFTPRACPAAPNDVASAALGFFGLTNTAMVAVFGLSSFNNCRRFGTSWALMNDIPVILPPGRLRIATSSCCTGSLPFANTIGMVVVAAFAASAETTLPVLKMTSTRRATSSAARRRQSVIAKIRPPVFDEEISFFDETCLVQPPANRCACSLIARFRRTDEKPQHGHLRLLRARRERPAGRAAEQRDELAPF